MLLLLVWRHLGVYGVEDGQVDLQNLNRSMRIAPSFDVSTFRADAGRKLGPVLHRMTAMVSGRPLQTLRRSLLTLDALRRRRRTDSAGSRMRSTWRSWRGGCGTLRACTMRRRVNRPSLLEFMSH